jgi:hypothetical protein
LKLASPLIRRSFRKTRRLRPQHCGQRALRIPAVHQVEWRVQAGCVKRGVECEHQALCMIVPVRLVSFSDLSSDGAHHCLDVAFLLAVCLRSISQRCSLSTSQKVAESREHLTHKTRVMVMPQQRRCAETLENAFFVCFCYILGSRRAHGLTHYVTRERVVPEQ